jgi:6-phosphogluconolactonase
MQKTPEYLIFDTQEALFAHAAAHVQQLAEEAVAARGRFLFVLSGGSTPAPLYRRLAQATGFPWPQTYVFWGDERMVPPHHPGSNFGQARELLLDHVPVAPEHVYRIRGEMDRVSAAEAYAHELLQLAGEYLPWPRFDLVLLGLGSDGHTASLFPGSTFPVRKGQATLAVSAGYDDRPAGRVTLTPSVFNSARNIVFLVTGGEKAEAVAAVLGQEADRVQWPAQRIRPDKGTLTWLLDREAAALLPAAPEGL